MRFPRWDKDAIKDKNTGAGIANILLEEIRCYMQVFVGAPSIHTFYQTRLGQFIILACF